MDTSKYVSWTPACLPKGEYELRVVFAEAFQGSKADDNGEFTTGTKFQYEVMGPATAVLSNGMSAIGYKFDELLQEPKASASPKFVEMCNGWWHAQLKAIFGDNIPNIVQPEDYIDRLFKAGCKPDWDDYKQADLPKITYRKAMTA